MPNAPIGVTVIVALTLVGLALFNQERRDNAAYQAARHGYELSKQTVPEDVAAHRPYTADKPYREEWRAEQDLEAQRAMARWAYAMVWVAVVSAVVTGIGILFVWLNLKEARMATQAAVAAAESAQASVDLERRREQPRIFVTAKWLPGASDISVVIRNIGKTPAIGIEGYSDRVEIASMPEAPPFGAPYSLDGVLLPPNDEPAVQRSAAGARTDFYSGREAIFGYFDYADVFDQRRRVAFCFRYDRTIQRCVRTGGDSYNYDKSVP